MLRRAVEDWNSYDNLLLVAQLGDLIDVKNTEGQGVRDAGTSMEALDKVKEVLESCVCKDVVNIIGNHEMYNFSRARLREVLLPSPDC